MANESLQFYLAEYNNLKKEIEQRIIVQNQTFNAVAIIIGAAVTLTGTLLSSDRSPVESQLEQLQHFELISRMVAFLPIAMAPLAYIFFDNELMIFGIGSYIFEDLRKRISPRVDAPENDLFLGDARVLKNLLPWSPQAQFLFSAGKWLLFIVLMWGPTIYVTFSTDVASVFPFWLVVGVDWLLSIFLILGIVATLREHLRWRFGIGARSE